MNLTKRNKLLYLITLIVLIGGDQFTKHLISSSMQLGQSQEIIDNFFYFTYAHNAGAAWGIFQGHLNLFFIISVVATIGIIYYFMQTELYHKLTRFGLVLVFSGMIGNLIDRIIFGYVRDFIDFIIIGYDFPIFNIADIAITVGVALVIFEVGIEEYKAWKISKSEL